MSRTMSSKVLREVVKGLDPRMVFKSERDLYCEETLRAKDRFTSGYHRAWLERKARAEAMVYDFYIVFSDKVSEAELEEIWTPFATAHGMKVDYTHVDPISLGRGQGKWTNTWVKLSYELDLPF